MSASPKVASLFAGIGGICLGFKQVGFNIVWANEINSAAAKTYRHNLGDVYLCEGNIKRIDPQTIPNFDVLAAGFPCQAFSAAGKQKGFGDPRGALFFEIVRILEEKRPRFVFLENVVNLADHNNGKTFLVVFNELVRSGYFVRYKFMDAQKYGNSPQKRERIYIVAFRNYEDCIRFCFPCEIALDVDVFSLIDRSVRQLDGYYYTNDFKFYDKLCDCMVDQNKIYRIHDGGKVSKGSLLCPTLVASMGVFTDRVPIVIDHFGIRRLTPEECLKIQGFPEAFCFPNGITQKDAYMQIGNTVCVPLVNRIAKCILELL